MCPMTLTGALQRLQAIPRLELGFFPTPVQELSRLRAFLGCGTRLFIKRDDWTGPGFGGNKVRKLEYYFAKALQQGYDSVITCGGEKSNHCRVTAALAAQLGLECHLVLNPAAQKHGKPASLWLDELFGAVIHEAGGREDRTRQMSGIAAELRGGGRRALEIPLGASTPLGALGFVRAVEELAVQMHELGIKPAAIVHSTSSGGTQAGLLAGLRLFQVDGTAVLGISADDPAAQIAATVKDIIAGIELELDAPACALQGEVHVDDAFTGSGYGIPSDEGEEALRLLAKTEGTLLDSVYTAKAFAGLLAHLRRGSLRRMDQVLFWHTGGQLALFDRAG